ncbi:hypothetical protein [Rufibacter sp. XAAS-G3-1]|uniref:hypothetical protein n=1 Tax=Rufibacter sp. XAAS-G3-1 TaxID=2729134 RepID=UPI0015E68038|nr:hypothetical protein [Rufibacter sp. XAAS-G3-1]
MAARSQPFHQPQGRRPDLGTAIQETKQSQFGDINAWYQHQLKAQWVREFKELQQEVIPWCEIRYIF